MSVVRPINAGTISRYTRHAKRFGGEFAWVATGQLVSALGSIVGVRVMTQALSPDQYGTLSLALTLTMLTLQVVLAPLANGVLRFFATASETQQIRPYLHAVKSLVGKATLILWGAFLIAVIGATFIGRENTNSLLIVAFVYSMILGYVGILNGIQNAARQRIIVAWHDGMSQWLRYLLAVLLIWLTVPTSQAAMTGFIIASTLVLASQWLFFRRGILIPSADQPRATEAEQQWKASIFTFAWPFATWGFFTWLQMSSDRWALEYFGTTAQVGLYAALYQLSVYPVVLLTGLLSQLITPILFNVAGDGSDPVRTGRAYTFVIRSTLFVMGVTIIAFPISWLLGPWIFSLLVDTEYQSVSSYVPWMVLGAGIFAAGQIAALNFLIGNRTQKLIVPKVTTALIGVAVNIIGAYLWGIEGLIVAGIVFSSLWLVWMLADLLMSRRSRAQSVIDIPAIHS